MKTPEQALAMLAEHGLMTLTGAGPLPSLVREVAGEEVKGSWWSHPAGDLIFRIGEALDDDPDTLSAKLVGGRVTFIHRALWPALLRMLTDPGWRKARTAELAPAARQLLARVERAGRVRFDVVIAELNPGEKKATKAAKDVVEKSLLVHVRQEHTKSGRHESVLSTWETLAKEREIKLPPKTLTLEKARAQLVEAAKGEPLGFDAGRAGRAGARARAR